MLITVFRDNKAFTLFFILLASVLYWSITGFYSHVEPGIYNLYEYGIFYLFPGLADAGRHPALGMAVNILCVLLTGFYLSRLLAKYQLLQGRTLMPMMVFLFFSFPWLYRLPGLSIPLLTIPVLVFVTHNLFETAESGKLAYGFFNNALLLSVASLFNHLLLFYTLFLILLFFRLRSGSARELIFIFIGTILPYAVLAALLYLFNVSIPGYVKSYSVLFEFKHNFPFDGMMVLFLSFYLLLFLVTSWRALNDFTKMKILIRKYAVSFLFLFLISLFLLLFFPYLNQESYLFVGIPLCFLFAYFFVNCRPNMINQVLFFLFLLSNVAVFVQDFFNL